MDWPSLRHETNYVFKNFHLARLGSTPGRAAGARKAPCSRSTARPRTPLQDPRQIVGLGEVYRSARDLVRVLRVERVSAESKAFGADPSKRACDAPGSWYCPGPSLP